MNKRYKWKLTKSTLRLVIVSAVAFLGLCLFGLSDLTTLYGVSGYFYLTDIPHFIFSGIKDSFITNYSYYMAINLVPIAISCVAAVLCVLCLLFKLKISNLVTLLLLCIGTASLLCVTSITFILVRDTAIVKELMDIALFKTVKTDFMQAIPALGIWIAALALIAAVVCYFIFIYYVIRDSFFKKPRLKGEAKYLYDHYDKGELAKLSATYQEGARYHQADEEKPAVTNTVVNQSAKRRPKRGTVNNITVNKGTPSPERSTNVVQFVNCDDTFVDQVKSKEEQTKGATFLESQRI